MRYFLNLLAIAIAISFFYSCSNIEKKFDPKVDHIELPNVTECIKLTNSFYCVNPKLDDYYFNKLLLMVSANGGLSPIEKDYLNNYFNIDRVKILSDKSFEIPIIYHRFFDTSFIYFQDEHLIKSSEINRILKKIEQGRIQ